MDRAAYISALQIGLAWDEPPMMPLRWFAPTKTVVESIACGAYSRAAAELLGIDPWATSMPRSRGPGPDGQGDPLEGKDGRRLDTFPTVPGMLSAHDLDALAGGTEAEMDDAEFMRTVGSLRVVRALAAQRMRQLQRRATERFESPTAAATAASGSGCVRRPASAAGGGSSGGDRTGDATDPSEVEAMEAVALCETMRVALVRDLGDKDMDDWMKEEGRPRLRSFAKDCMARDEHRTVALLLSRVLEWAVMHPEVRDQEDDVLVADDLSSLGNARSKFKHYEAAEQAYLEALQVCERRPFDEDASRPLAGLIMNNYADVLLMTGRLDEAERWCRRAMGCHDAGEAYAKKTLGSIMHCKDVLSRPCNQNNYRVKNTLRLQAKVERRRAAGLAPEGVPSGLLPPAFYGEAVAAPEAAVPSAPAPSRRKGQSRSAACTSSQEAAEADPGAQTLKKAPAAAALAAEAPRATTTKTTPSSPLLPHLAGGGDERWKDLPPQGLAPDATSDCSTSAPPCATEAQEEDGLCIACKERPAEVVGAACGHLVFCKACRRTVIHKALKDRNDGREVKKRKDLGTRELERTVVPCPLCRADGVLSQLVKFRGQVFGLDAESASHELAGLETEPCGTARPGPLPTPCGDGKER